MRAHYVLRVDVPGGLGPRTELDARVHPPKVSRLHFVFDGWTDDPLVTSFPCYLIAPTLAQKLEKNGVSGFDLADVEIEASDEFHELHPGKVPPAFCWMKVYGHRNTHDVYITEDHRLGVSRKAIDLILETRPGWLAYYEDPAI